MGMDSTDRKVSFQKDYKNALTAVEERIRQLSFEKRHTHVLTYANQAKEFVEERIKLLMAQTARDEFDRGGLKIIQGACDALAALAGTGHGRMTVNRLQRYLEYCATHFANEPSLKIPLPQFQPGRERKKDKQQDRG